MPAANPPAPPPGGDAPAPEGLRLDLRILATTDLHMHLLPHDYFADRGEAPFGLARVAPRIEALRSEAANCLLLDNGDLLQGNLLGDFLALPGREGWAHPAIACLNALRYDAATLGNHDFSYGTAYVARLIGQARYPVVLANARLAGARSPFRPWVALDRDFTARDGRLQRLRIGVIGFVPPQTPDWEPGLTGRLICEDILQAAARHLPAMRAAGCALIVALCHGGIAEAEPQPGMENAAAALAALDVDAVICGHTHLVFPGPDIAPAPGIEPEPGRLHGKPAVMPGFWGSHLGVIDLALSAEGGRWRVAAATSRAEPCRTVPPSPALVAQVQPAHEASRRHFARKVGQSDVALNSHFAQLGFDAGLRLVAMASRWHLRHALAGTPAARLPILAAVAPFRSGGRGGPAHYTDVPAGRLSLRALADLYLFPNSIAALEMTGEGLRDWLERAGAQFATLRPGAAHDALLDPALPGYNFDVIAGLSWRYDLSAEPLYTPEGQPRGAGPGRVRDLRFAGEPLRDSARFVLATNSYRLGAHGLFGGLADCAPRLLQGDERMRDILALYLRKRRRVAPRAALGWGFAPLPGTSAIFATGPGAPPPPGLDLTPEGIDAEGFMRWRLRL